MDLKVIAHRGFGADEFGVGDYVENSINAFQRGFDLKKIYACETDVRFTKDGVIVCYHDPEVDKIPLKDISYEELIRLRPLTPTFQELYNKFPNERFIIELKPEEDNEKILNFLFENYILIDKNPLRFSFISFCFDNLLLVKSLNKETYCSWIVSSKWYDPKRYQLFAWKSDIDKCAKFGINEISGHIMSFRKSLIKYAHQNDLIIGMGPTNSIKRLDKSIKKDADVIYTDLPELIIKNLF